MTNYKEQSGAFARWTRAGFVMIKNSFGKAPEITYAEQEISSFDGGEPTIKRLNALQKGFDPSFTFPVYDPTTGEYLRDATEAEYYTLGASHYLATAALRDAGDPAVTEVTYPRIIPMSPLNPVPSEFPQGA
jgi:hypothetical protein